MRGISHSMRDIIHTLTERLKATWNSIWFAEVSAYPIAAYRILLGLYFFLYMLASAPNVPVLFSNQGVYSPFLIPDIAPPVGIAWLVYLLTLSLAAAFALGIRTRIVTPLLLTFVLYHFLLNIACKACSYDKLSLFSLALMCFGETDAVWSIDAWLKKLDKSPEDQRSLTEPKVSAWLTRLLAIHLAIFYFLTGMFKLLSPGWHNGDVLRGVMSSLYASDAGFTFLSLHLPSQFYDIMAFLTIAFELSCPIMFFIKRFEFNLIVGSEQRTIKCENVQYWFFLFGLMFHTGIWMMMQLPQFMICPFGYVLFMDGQQVRSLVPKLWQGVRWVLIRTELWYEQKQPV